MTWVSSPEIVSRCVSSYCISAEALGGGRSWDMGDKCPQLGKGSRLRRATPQSMRIGGVASEPVRTIYCRPVVTGPASATCLQPTSLLSPLRYCGQIRRFRIYRPHTSGGPPLGGLFCDSKVRVHPHFLDTELFGCAALGYVVTRTCVLLLVCMLGSPAVRHNVSRETLTVWPKCVPVQASSAFAVVLAPPTSPRRHNWD